MYHYWVLIECLIDLKLCLKMLQIFTKGSIDSERISFLSPCYGNESSHIMLSYKKSPEVNNVNKLFN